MYFGPVPELPQVPYSPFLPHAFHRAKEPLIILSSIVGPITCSFSHGIIPLPHDSHKPPTTARFILSRSSWFQINYPSIPIRLSSIS
jgi:hypothetical protein